MSLEVHLAALGPVGGLEALAASLLADGSSRSCVAAVASQL